jgi:hypothetical protein
MCTCNVCESARADGEYISPTYHHGLDEGMYRSERCACGYWECEGRGCGDCPSCYGEPCECGLFDDTEADEYRDLIEMEMGIKLERN